MKHLIKQYLDRSISRRHFLSGLGTLGITSVAANSMASTLAPFMAQAANENAEGGQPSWLREMKGSGGALLVAQLKAAGIRHLFFNPASAAAPVYDAMVDETDIQLIQALEEGALAAMADGYAKATGKPSFALIAPPGVPSFMTQMFNSWKDRTPVVLATDYAGRDNQGRDGSQDTDHMEVMTSATTKWHWVAQSAQSIPEVTRRALKFATTSPCGPVFLAFPGDTLREEAGAAVMDQSKFSVSMKIRPDPALVEQAARMLLEARNPVLYIGDEITWCGAQKEVVQLAELLGIPVTQTAQLNLWSKPFPSRHPLYVGVNMARSRFPGEADVTLNLGGRTPVRMNPKAKLIQIELDPDNLARVTPTDVGMIADMKLAVADLLAALHSMATDARLKQISEERIAKAREFTTKMREFRLAIGKDTWDRNPISIERVAMELENVLEKDTCLVAESDSGRESLETFLTYGPEDKRWFSQAGVALGWCLGGAFGVKLALPDQPVVAVVSDGAFMFRGPQPLWSYARYRAPITVVVINNQCYNNERNRMLGDGGRQFQTGRDMTCYLGDPAIDFAKLASGLGVEGEVVRDPAMLRPALERAKKATVSGRPYLLDVHVGRDGIGAASDWHPEFTIEALRQRKV
jgi:acetolactate synthase I/II/III large subunit